MKLTSKSKFTHCSYASSIKCMLGGKVHLIVIMSLLTLFLILKVHDAKLKTSTVNQFSTVNIQSGILSE